MMLQRSQSGLARHPRHVQLCHQQNLKTDTLTHSATMTASTMPKIQLRDAPSNSWQPDEPVRQNVKNAWTVHKLNGAEECH
jgi:hypothetical protein